MRKLFLFIVLVSSMSVIGCNKDSEVKTFLTEFENVTKEMTARLNEGDITGAQKVFADKKEGLKAGFDSFKNAREMQVSDETKKEMETTVMENVKALSEAATKAAFSSGDKAKAEEIQALLKDYVSIFQM